MRFVTREEVDVWLAGRGPVGAFLFERSGAGLRRGEAPPEGTTYGVPVSLAFAIETLLPEDPAAGDDALDSIPFYSLLKGLVLPLAGLRPEQVAALFGFRWSRPEGGTDDLVRAFLERDLGLSLVEKVSILLGDPFRGGRAGVGFDSLVQVLSVLRFESAALIRRRLPLAGDFAALFTEDLEARRSDPPLAAREVLLVLRGLAGARWRRRKEILVDLYRRAGRLERYFLTKLALRKLDLGFGYRVHRVFEAISQLAGLDPGRAAGALALKSPFEVAALIEERGEEGLDEVMLRPLNPVSPALAGSGKILDAPGAAFPMWFGRKYDGIRILLHKSTGGRGEVLGAAFTRRGNDWIERFPGLAAALRFIPARSFIIDGELHGDLVTPAGSRPASVYELFKFVQGVRERTIVLRYAAFDVLFAGGRDFTKLPFTQRREFLGRLLAPVLGLALPIPLALEDGQVVSTVDEVRNLYQYFRRQGYEGGIAKVLDAPYQLGRRTDDWMKLKPVITLDLVVTGAIWSASADAPLVFGSLLISCRETETGGLREIGSVQALDRERMTQIVGTIWSEGLLSGETLERRTAQATRAGVALRPHIVVQVKFEGIVKDEMDSLALRDPKIVSLRTLETASPDEIDTYQRVQELHLKQGLT